MLSSSMAIPLAEVSFFGAAEIEVFVDSGEPGTNASGAVEAPDSVSVAELEIGSMDEGDASDSKLSDCCISCSWSVVTIWCFGISNAFAFGERMGIWNSEALFTMCDGGRALGEIMIPNASAGSSGLNDAMTHS